MSIETLAASILAQAQGTTDAGKISIALNSFINNSANLPTTVYNALTTGGCVITDSANVLLNLWLVRNACITNKHITPATAFPVSTFLSSIPVDYFAANPNVIDTFMKLIDENGKLVFADIKDFYSQAVGVTLTTVGVAAQDLCNIDTWKSTNQVINIYNAPNTLYKNVLGDDLASLVKSWAGIKTRVTYGNAVANAGALTAGTQNAVTAADGVSWTGGALGGTYLSLAFPNVTAAGLCAVGTTAGTLSTLAIMKQYYPATSAPALPTTAEGVFAPEFTAIAKYLSTSSVSVAFNLVKSFIDDVGKALMVNNCNKSFSVYTFIYFNYITSALIAANYSTIKIKDIATFVGKNTTFTTPSFGSNLTNYPALISSVSTCGSIFSCLSSLAYAASDVYTALLTDYILLAVAANEATVVVKAIDFDAYFNNYIKKLPLLKRLQGLTATAPVVGTGVGLSTVYICGNDKPNDIFDTIYANNIPLQKTTGTLTTAALFTPVASSDSAVPANILYAAALATYLVSLNTAPATPVSTTAFGVPVITPDILASLCVNTATSVTYLSIVTNLLTYTSLNTLVFSCTTASSNTSNYTNNTALANAIGAKQYSSLDAPSAGASAGGLGLSSANKTAVLKKVASNASVTVSSVVVAGIDNTTQAAVNDKFQGVIDTINSLVAGGTSYADVLNTPKGKWSNNADPIYALLLSFLDGKKQPSVSALNAVLDYMGANNLTFLDALTSLSTSSVTYAGDVATISFIAPSKSALTTTVSVGVQQVLLQLIMRARNNTDFDNINAAAGTSTPIKLAHLGAVLGSQTYADINRFTYVFSKYTSVELAAQFGYEQHVDSTNTPAKGSIVQSTTMKAAKFWILFKTNDVASLVGVVPADDLFGLTKPVYSYTIAGGINPVSTKTVFMFQPADIKTAYNLTDAQVAASAAVNGLVLG
jgi:hypothetical protein